MIRVVAYDKSNTYEFDQPSLDETLHHPTTWVDISDPSEAELKLMQERFNLDPLAIEDVIHKGQRPKIEDYESHLFAVLHLPHHEGDEIKVDELFLFLGEKWLISIHSGNPQVMGEVAKALSGGPHKLRLKGPDFLYHLLTDLAVDEYFTILDTIEDEIDMLEELVEEEPRKEMLRKIDIVGRQLTLLRRSLWPMQDMMGRIMKGIYPLISDQSTKYFRDIHDHLARLIDLIETHHGRLNSVRDLYLSSLTSSTNEVLAILTIMFTLTLPAVTIGTFYGMNINLPGGIETGVWTFLGPYTTFIIILISSTVPATLLLWYFRRRGWV